MPIWLTDPSVEEESSPRSFVISAVGDRMMLSEGEKPELMDVTPLAASTRADIQLRLVMPACLLGTLSRCSSDCLPETRPRGHQVRVGYRLSRSVQIQRHRTTENAMHEAQSLYWNALHTHVTNVCVLPGMRL